MRLDAYTVVLLRRPPDAPQLGEAELDRLQREHVDFNSRMRAEGHALITGPFTDQPDPSWRGLSVFRTSIAKTRELIAGDPLGRAGRLEFELFTWLMPEGLLGDRPAGTIDED
jgi:hypothetical protein